MQPTNSQSKADILREQIQENVLKLIEKKIQSGEMSQERAKQIAQLVIEKLPEGINYQQLIQILPTLDDDFKELSVVILPIMLEYENKIRKLVNEKIKTLVKEGRLDEALEISQKALEQTK